MSSPNNPLHQFTICILKGYLIPIFARYTIKCLENILQKFWLIELFPKVTENFKILQGKLICNCTTNYAITG